EEQRFRRFLAGFAPVALDLVLADRVHARRLVATMRWQVTRPRGSLRAHLEPACLAGSARYRCLAPAARTRFWRDLAHWPNPPQVDWAHMLVNMVLGFDWPPAEFLTPAPALDVEAINARLAACPGTLAIPADWRPDPSARAPRIRRAGADDAAAVAAFGARTFAAAFGADNRPEDMHAYLETSFDRARIAGELADADTVFLLAEDGGELAGYAMLRHAPAPAPLARERSMEIVRIYAATARIGRGYGSALMAACLDEARSRGCDSIWLGVWERNERAIAFYRRWGFEVIGAHDFVLGSDVQNDLIMAKRLDAPG
ncbi:MAG: GNAT family N-acetyltransferase, partial [Gammaproteobacteria bacterium]|nr:GNAT family N-acetyltransferase [Gammaproteobacteria bacterium]